MAAEKERRRTRINSKIDQLPPEAKAKVDDMVADSSFTYQDIADWLKEQGYEISRGAVGRYAIRINEAAQRMAEQLEQTRLTSTGSSATRTSTAKAAQAVMASGIMQRVSTADGEFLEMPLEKAGRLLASFRRVDVAERKMLFDMRQKIDLAFEELEHQLMDAIKSDPALSAQMREILTKAKEKMVADE